MNGPNSAISILKRLHQARLDGDITTMCALFQRTGKFTITGASDGKPIAVRETTIEQFQPWLTTLVRMFKIDDYERISEIAENEKSCIVWQCQIRSKITGLAVQTQLVDVVKTSNGQIASYMEMFTPI